MKKKRNILDTALVLFALIGVILFIYSQFGGINKDESLNGISVEQAMEKKGVAEYDVQFILSDSSLYEYQYGLKNIYPMGTRDNRPILIREIGWQTWGRTTVIWFEYSINGWRSIDNLSWGISVQF